MQQRTILLAEQLLGSISKSEIKDLILLLSYYNRFPEDQRILGMLNGSTNPENTALEKEVSATVRSVTKSMRNQAVYVITNQQVCRCCGK